MRKGAPEGDDVAYGNRPPGANAEAVKDDEVVRRGRVWIECGLTDGNGRRSEGELGATDLHASTSDGLYGVAVVGKGHTEGQPVQYAEGPSSCDVHPNGLLA